jgi:hypothetical protein
MIEVGEQHALEISVKSFVMANQLVGEREAGHDPAFFF